jgi:transcriptional regulator with XRE-family HTH domain
MPMDAYIGTRIRQRRMLLAMSQTKLGNAVGLTFQQILHYEHGSNRTSSSRLYEFAKVLDVPVSLLKSLSGQGMVCRRSVQLMILDYSKRALSAAAI